VAAAPRCADTAGQGEGAGGAASRESISVWRNQRVTDHRLGRRDALLCGDSVSDIDRER
jgi:hypothetical protein